MKTQRWERWLSLALCLSSTGAVVAQAPVVVTAPEASADKRRTEIEVQLAWLADPVTFPHYLEAHLLGSRLEIRGHVPNKQVHEHALKLAMAQSPLDILDAIRETPGCETRPQIGTADSVRALAQAQLKRLFPSETVTVAVREGGQVALSGKVATWEQKSALAQALRHVPGCTSLVNGLSVEIRGALKKGSQTITMARDDDTGPEVIFITPVLSVATNPAPSSGEPSQIPVVKAPEPRVETPSIAVKMPEPKVETPGLAVKVPAATVQVNRHTELEKTLSARIPQTLKIMVQEARGNQLRIDLWVRSEAEGYQAAGVLNRIDELGKYHCDIHIHHE